MSTTGKFGVVCCIRSSSGVESLAICTLHGRKVRTRNFSYSNRFGTTITQQIPSTILLSVVLPSASNLTVVHHLHTSHLATAIPVVVLATGSARLSGIVTLSNNTSSCLAGPFSLVRLTDHYHTLLHHNNVIGRTDSILDINSVILSPDRHRIAITNRPLGLALHRFSLLRCLVHGPNIIFAHRSLLRDI